jgi:hypothetical protein
MSPLIGWALAAAALFVGWRWYGLQGVAFAATLIIFWLLLQFSRSMRAMRNASAAPVGYVPSAVMLNARLRKGLLMLQVLGLTKSLGRRVRPDAEIYAWADEGRSEVVVTFVKGRCASWVLNRPGPSPE